MYIAGVEVRKALLMKRLLIASLATLVTLPQITLADVESRTLLRRGAWSVNLVHDPSDGDVWCSGETYNRSNQSLSVATFSDGFAALFITDARWRLTRRPVSFVVSTDYTDWTIDGEALVHSVFVELSDPQKSAQFVEELAAGRFVTIFSLDGQRLASFSLQGSRVSMNVLMECWQSIGRAADPFGGSADPLGASADPFY